MAAFAAMLAVSWRRWPDPLVDFGLEAETARELALGKMLHRDVATLHGPLPLEVAGLVVRIAGPSLIAIFAVNLIVLAGVTGLSYLLVRRIAGRLAATAAVLFFLVVLAFGQYTAGGNYNWISPYAAGSTWGVLFGFLMLEMLARHEETKRAAFIAAAGLALGFCFLTKSEPFVAALMAAMAFLPLLFLRMRIERRMLLRRAAGLAIAALVPPLLFFTFYAVSRGALSPSPGSPGAPGALSSREALRVVLGPWPALLGSSASQLPFFRELMGTSDIGASFGALAKWSLVWLAVFIPGFVAARRWRLSAGSTRISFAIGLAAVVLFLASTFRSNGWFEAARPLPLFLGALIFSLFLSKKEFPVFSPVVLSLSVFALVLLSKILLAVRLTHYGFTLAVPAALLAVAALTSWIPESLAARGGEGRVFRAYAGAVLAVMAGVYVANSSVRLARRTCEVGAGPDRFFADERGCLVQQVLLEIGKRAGPRETLAVLPEGGMVNFLALRSNPTPFLSLMPLEIGVFGEERVLSAYRARPPDWILLVHRDSSEFGPRFFGVDYAKDASAWIVESYEDALLLGEPPFEGPYFGMRLLKRRTPGPI